MERWEQVKGTFYEVSDRGRIRNMATGKVLKPRFRGGTRDGKPYMAVDLYENDGRRTEYVHRIVADVFCGTKRAEEVHHIDGDRTNNSADNLMWVTSEENNHYRTNGAEA